MGVCALASPWQNLILQEISSLKLQQIDRCQSSATSRYFMSQEMRTWNSMKLQLWNRHHFIGQNFVICNVSSWKMEELNSQVSWCCFQSGAGVGGSGKHFTAVVFPLLPFSIHHSGLTGFWFCTWELIVDVQGKSLWLLMVDTEMPGKQNPVWWGKIFCGMKHCHFSN